MSRAPVRRHDDGVSPSRETKNRRRERLLAYAEEGRLVIEKFSRSHWRIWPADDLSKPVEYWPSTGRLYVPWVAVWRYPSWNEFRTHLNLPPLR